MKQNNSVIETKYYLGSYEKQVSGGTTREIHYVGGGNGLCAVIVREGGVSNFYFVYTDHLGSILTVTDINGNVVAEQNFDAWGRKRDPVSWQYSSVPAAPAWLYRGFTGHEHLLQFTVINMNGRIYDPIQGRMLSPDNYVGDPLSTQGYNRYTYANNNPLVYVDPDGNFPWLVVAMVAGTFATGNTVAHAIKMEIQNFWDGLEYFSQGAIVVGLLLDLVLLSGLNVPVLGPIIKGAGYAYAGATALSLTSGAIRSIATGDINPLGNAIRISLGNFYLDENRNFFAGVWQGI